MKEETPPLADRSAGTGRELWRREAPTGAGCGQAGERESRADGS